MGPNREADPNSYLQPQFQQFRLESRPGSQRSYQLTERPMLRSRVPTYRASTDPCSQDRPLSELTTVSRSHYIRELPLGTHFSDDLSFFIPKTYRCSLIWLQEQHR